MTFLLRLVAVVPYRLCVFTQVTSADPFDMQGDVQDLLETVREAYVLPGATVAYIAGDRDVWSFAPGLADVEADVPMAPESRMLAASIGRTIWGAPVLPLVSEGLLSRILLIAHRSGAGRPSGCKTCVAQMTVLRDKAAVHCEECLIASRPIFQSTTRMPRIGSLAAHISAQMAELLTRSSIVTEALVPLNFTAPRSIT